MPSFGRDLTSREKQHSFPILLALVSKRIGVAMIGEHHEIEARLFCGKEDVGHTSRPIGIARVHVNDTHRTPVYIRRRVAGQPRRRRLGWKTCDNGDHDDHRQDGGR